jgi:hypothetical protein
MATLIKVVYFDEESASDYLDISAGGKTATTSEQVKDRTTKMHSEVESRLAAKFSWLPFLGASAEVGAGVDLARTGQSILRKTLSNTILTDYLDAVAQDSRVTKLTGLRVTAPEGSLAHVKMFTPYTVILRTEEHGIDLARLDEALASANGYYEMLGKADGEQRAVLRFNINAFRNNYGLADLGKMRLTFHGIHVGKICEQELTMQAQMQTEQAVGSITAAAVLDGTAGGNNALLNVYDVLLAGVEHVG